MRISAIILAGGLSKRLGQEKALVLLAGRRLILHVLERVSSVVDETLVVINVNSQREKYEALLAQKARVIVDKYETQSPLIGALTGFESSQGKYSLLLPCDTPFISNAVTSFLLDVCEGKSAAIPKWPNGFIEPLQAAYNTKSAFSAAKKAVDGGEFTMQAMINRLLSVRYVSTLVLQEFDSKLLTFFNVNMMSDLKKAESIIKHRTRTAPKL